MSKHPTLVRRHVIQRLRGSLERDGYPRLQMFLLVALTGASGFVASFVMLRLGVVDMWLRYLAAFGFAYVVFLFLLWLWLRTRSSDHNDLPDVSDLTLPDSGDSEVFMGGGGGDFGGGGATGNFDAPSEGTSEVVDVVGSVGDALGNAAEAEEFAIPLFLLILFGAFLFSFLFIIDLAPILFAELVIDGVLSAGLYRRLRGLETRHWLETALRRTALPFALTAAVVSASAWGLALYAPGAHSIGDVVVQLRRGG